MPGLSIGLTKDICNNNNWMSDIYDNEKFIRKHLVLPRVERISDNFISVDRMWTFESEMFENAFRQNSSSINKYEKLLTEYKKLASEINLAKEIIITPNAVPIEISIKNTFPAELSHIENAVLDARSILELESNWDDEGALKVPLHIFNRAMDFIRNYSTFVRNNFQIVIIAPDINPLRDGSIDLYWKTKNASLLVNIKNDDDEIAYYYGVLYNQDKNTFDINGQISTNSTIDMFASWFSCFPEMEKGAH